MLIKGRIASAILLLLPFAYVNANTLSVTTCPKISDTSTYPCSAGYCLYFTPPQSDHNFHNVTAVYSLNGQSPNRQRMAEGLSIWGFFYSTHKPIKMAPSQWLNYHFEYDINSIHCVTDEFSFTNSKK